MPAPLARGIIIAASVLVAAGIAAYENPQFREWFERSREKIAVAFHSTLDDIRPLKPKRNDPSMSEDQDEKAEERRKQARQEILDRGKKLEELRKRQKRKSSSEDEKRSPSFDTLVDEDGNLRPDASATANIHATSSAVEAQDQPGSLRSRNIEPAQNTQTEFEKLSASTASHSADFSILDEPIDEASATASVPWESQYEREMRNTWNIPLPTDRTPTASTHPSESLVDLTPTTEDFPDPDYSIPYGSETGDLQRTEYFSIPPSRARSVTAGRSDTGSESEYYYARPSSPHRPAQPHPITITHNINSSSTAAAAASVAGSNRNRDYDMASQSEFESDDGFSELGDGIRTPASAWTEIGSTISASDAEEIR